MNGTQTDSIRARRVAFARWNVDDKQTGADGRVCNKLEGGVGKSTVTALLARYALERLKKDVLAIDLDPQANLSQAFMRNTYGSFVTNQLPSIVEVFNGYIPPSKSTPSPQTLASGSAIHNVETIGAHKLGLIPSRFDFSDNLLKAIRPDPRVLAKHLVGNFSTKDLILIDCAPTESILTQAAYHASSKVLIPVRPEFFATIGFPLLRQSLDNFKAANKAHAIDVAGIVVNNAFYDGGNNGGPEKAAAMKDIRADFDRHESRGDSQEAESLIQNAGWGMEASMHGSASLDGFAHAAFGRD